MTKRGAEPPDEGSEESAPTDGARASRPTRCRWCRRVLAPQQRGRPREFCSQACRQWDWVGRQRAQELQLSESELIVAKSELDALHDELYVLACTVDDTDRDLAGRSRTPTAHELAELLQWLLEAARPLRNRELGAP
jgi:hypothetical protein